MARRKRLVISIPDYLESELRDHVYSSHFSSISEYIRELVRRDLQNSADNRLAWSTLHARQPPVQQRANNRPMFRLVD